MKALVMFGVWIAGIAFARAGEDGKEFVVPIARAHHAAAWYAKGAVKTRLQLFFGGKKRFAGVLTMAPTAAETRLELDSGTTLGFDGKTAWVEPADADFEKPRFHALTWAYFLAAPYKLGDRGVKIEATGKRQLQGKEYDTAKLTFVAGTGDAPDDWYVLYRDPETNRLAAMAYIVTYGGKDAAKASEDPHAITYEEFEDKDGIPVPMRWRFWEWSEKHGLGKELGRVDLSGVEFTGQVEGSFRKPAGAREVPLPK